MRREELERIHAKVLRYSRHIAGGRGEVDDLAQDALLKVWRALEREPDRELTNAYLYEIVLNAWKDKLRKEKALPRPTEWTDDWATDDMGLSTRELLEVLAHRLSPRAMAILLLMDVFDFTAKETAAFLSSTEGAVQVALGRARNRLKSLARSQEDVRPPAKHGRVELAEERMPLDALVDAFRRRDVKALCRSFVGVADSGLEIRHIRFQEGRFYFYLRDPDGHQFMVTS